MIRKALVILVAVFISVSAFCQNGGTIALAPPMGWNSWNFFGKNVIDERIVIECIDAMVENGLKDAGYEYFVIDGGWRDTLLADDGRLLAHPIKFPNGIKPLAEYAHSKGLKFGLHTVPGTHDCGDDEVGGYGIEEIHIQQFIDWGVDFIKLDKCFLKLGCKKSCWDEGRLEAAYRRWRKVLDEKGSEIVLSISAYKFRDWNPEVCNMSRTSGDIACRISGGAYFRENDKRNQPKDKLSVLKIADINNQHANYAKPGYWNDPDMLVTGENGLTFDEQYSHFALWCIMSSPLFLGNDPRLMSDTEKEIILNKTAISINQDPTEQGVRILQKDGFEIWKKNLKDGSVAVLIINTTPTSGKKMELDLNQTGIKAASEITDVFASNTIEFKEKLEFTIDSHACKFLLFKRR